MQKARYLTITGFFCMVPTTGLEPVQLAPLPPQDSVSTNSTTSAKQAGIIPYYLFSCTGFSAGAAGAAGTSVTTEAGAGGTSLLGATGAAGATSTAFGAAGAAAEPIILPDDWTTVPPDVRKARLSATRKKIVAKIPVVRLRKLAEPCDPKTVPDAPLPKAAPASAPLPCCIKINTIMATETTIKMINKTLYNIAFFD